MEAATNAGLIESRIQVDRAGAGDHWRNRCARRAGDVADA
jgi:hypothetical protein